VTGIKEEKARKLLRIVSLFSIIILCAFLFPKARDLIVNFVVITLDRDLANHDILMKIILESLLFAIVCFIIILIFTIKDLSCFINNRYFSETMMVFLFFVVSALIFRRSYFGGFCISPDSNSYLRAAQSILNGYGFRVYAEAGLNDFYFSHWPIGYPFLIACVSFITGTDVYLASKILTILTLAGIFGLLYRQFGKKAWIYALIMVCYPSFLTDFYYTWSEQAFLFASLLLTFEIIKIISVNKPKLHHYFNVLIACLLMFFVRYAGIQAIGVISLTLICFIAVKITTGKSMFGKIIPLMTVGFIFSLVCSGYLYLNYSNTGYFGGNNGYNRGTVNSFGYIINSIISLCIGQVIEVSYIFQVHLARSYNLILIALFILIFIFFQFRKEFRIKHSLDSFVLIMMSMFYIFAFLFFRITTEVDKDYTRHLLVPAILFAFWCITLFLESRNSSVIQIRQFIQKRKVLCFCVFFVWFGISPLGSYAECLLGLISRTNVSYQQIRHEILDDLSSVPPGSFVIIGPLYQKESFVNFLRPDLLPVNINDELLLKENMELFGNHDNVYLYLDTEYIIPDYLLEILQKNDFSRAAVSSRNDRLIKIR